MSETPKSNLSAGAIAKELGVPEAKVKKAIAALNLEPAAKKGVCNLYAVDAIPQIKAAIG